MAATMTRQQIIDLINQYIYTNGRQRITAAQLNEILIEIANAFAMNGGGGAAGIDAVLEEGSIVSNGRHITNENGGKLELAATYISDMGTYNYVGFDAQDPQHEGVIYSNVNQSFIGNSLREDSSRSFFEMASQSVLPPGEVLAASTYVTLEIEAIPSGVYHFAISETGRNVHYVRANRIASNVGSLSDGFNSINSSPEGISSYKEKEDDIYSGCNQTVEKIDTGIRNLTVNTYYSQEVDSLSHSITDLSGVFNKELNSSAQNWSDQVGLITAIENDGVRLTEGKRLTLDSSGSAPTSGIATLFGGTISVFTSAVTPDSVISLTTQDAGAFGGSVRVSAKVAGSHFNISSNEITDNCTVFWQIIDLVYGDDFSEFSDEYDDEFY